jgi:hypothetical protein
LYGDMKYKFVVQSVSAAGPSAFSTQFVEVVTSPPIAPAECLLFSEDKHIQLRDPTTSLALRWLTPASGGGSDIVDYEVRMCKCVNVSVCMWIVCPMLIFSFLFFQPPTFSFACLILIVKGTIN